MAEVTSTPSPTRYESSPRSHLRQFNFTVRIDSDCVSFYETQAQAEGMTLSDWISRNANSALRTLYGM